MRLRKLFESLLETPIEDIHTYGDTSQEGSFRQSDLGIVNSEKGQDKIQRVLFKIPVPVVLHFVHTPEVIRGVQDVAKHINTDGRNLKIGLFDIRTFKRVYGVDLNFDPRALNVAYIENEGAQRYPLTPWIIAHRLDHAFSFMDRASYHNHVSNDSYREVSGSESGISRALYGAVGNLFHIDTKKSFIDNLLYQAVLTSILDTKAGREKNLTSAAEFEPEIFAQYCVTGHIKFRPFNINDWPYHQNPNSSNGPTHVTPESVAQFNQQMIDLIPLFEANFLRMLQWGIGKILVL